VSKNWKIVVALVAGFFVLRILGLQGMALVPLYGMTSILPFAAIIYVVVFLNGRKKKWQRASKGSIEKNLESIMAQFGANDAEKENNINKIFDEKKGNIDVYVDYIGPHSRVFDKDGSPFSIRYLKCHLSRSLAAMSARDREAVRAALLLKLRGLNPFDGNSYWQILSILYGDGKGTVFSESDGKKPIAKQAGGREQSAESALKSLCANVDQQVDIVLRELAQALDKNPDHPTLRPLAARLLGTGTDMAPAPDGALKLITDLSQTGAALIIGEDERDPSKLWTFDGEGALLTIAPPGSGKTQSHVLPNLLTWKGPAVVLDIKGEIHAGTAAWRKENVGPVFKFSPLDPGASHSYNPLLGVSDDPEHIWEDSRFLADMLIVPSGAKDPFWENRARDILTAAIAVTVRNRPAAERTMEPVLDILHNVGWDTFILSLQAATDVPPMVRMGKSLGEMEAKTRDGVLQSALASLSAWAGTRIARATERSDWTPAELRSGRNPTIYVCIKPNEIDSYASMLRVIIAQHIRALTTSLPERGQLPILFILDELPRLKHMPPVEEALEIGRGYGLKLWMFAQSLGQLKTSYANADGMAGACALRLFMNPSLHDETAQKLSDDMGYRESVIDGTRVKRVEADVLAGPEFTDKVIVMPTGAPPARLRKHFAYSDPELTRRASLGSEVAAAK